MYATIDEIKSSSKNVCSVLEASPSDLMDWMEEAAQAIDGFCSQDFLFEPQTTKRILLDSSLVVLPKYLSGKVTAKLEGGGSLWFDSVNVPSTSGGDIPSSDLEHVAGEYILRYRPLNVIDWNPMTRVRRFMLVTGDWGYASSLENLLISYANELKVKYNSHRLDTEAHYVADSTNVITAADATDLSSAIALLNDARAAINGHFADITVHAVADTDVVTSASATDIVSAQALALEIDRRYLAHMDDTNNSHVGATQETDRTTLSTDNPVMPRAIKRTFIRLVKRIAIREDGEDLVNMNAGYASETTGDGYRYDLSNGTLRNLIRPEDFTALWPYQHDGKVVF